jgi:hypothetical protein
MNKLVRILISGTAFLFIIGLFVFVATTQAATIASGDLIKASGPAVYYYGADSKRYVFPNQNTYLSWYTNFSTVKTISDSELANIPIGGNVTYRPGVNLVKITTDPKVYAVDAHGILRWIATAAVAQELYGPTWTQKVEDLPDAFFVNYNIGSQISSTTDFSPNIVKNNATSINADKLNIAQPTSVRYTSSLGLSFLYYTKSSGRPDLAPSGEQTISVSEKTTSDGSVIYVGKEQDVKNGSGDITIEIHRIPAGETAEFYANELTYNKVSNCTFRFDIKQTTDYTTFDPVEVGQYPAGSCFMGTAVAYTQYKTRPDLLVAAYWAQDPFLTQEEINSIISSISVN